MNHLHFNSKHFVSEGWPSCRRTPTHIHFDLLDRPGQTPPGESQLVEEPPWTPRKSSGEREVTVLPYPDCFTESGRTERTPTCLRREFKGHSKGSLVSDEKRGRGRLKSTGSRPVTFRLWVVPRTWGTTPIGDCKKSVTLRISLSQSELGPLCASGQREKEGYTHCRFFNHV